MSTWTGWVTFFKTMNTIRQGKRKYTPYALNTGLLANKANVVPTTVYHQNIHCPEEKLDEELNVLMCFPLFSSLKYKINAKKSHVTFLYISIQDLVKQFFLNIWGKVFNIYKRKRKRKHYGFFFHFYTMFITRYTSVIFRVTFCINTFHTLFIYVYSLSWGLL